jgi:GDP-L-fucose synthase
VGSGYEISIKDLALEISELAGFNGKINWDLNSANGATRKILDSNYINSLGWKVKTNFSRGLERTYDWFKHNYESARL